MPMTKEEKQEIAEIVKASFEESSKELRDDIDEKINEITKESKKIEKKVLGEKKDFSGLEKKEKFVKLFKAIYKNDQETIKALNEGTDSAGGYLVDDEFIKEILVMIEEYGVVRKYATVLKTSSDSVRMPKSLNKVAVSWVNENAAIPETSATFGEVTITIKKMAAIVTLTNELIEDADVDLIDFLFDLFAEAIALEEDKQGLAGDGTVFTGVLNDTDANIVVCGASFSATTADHLRSMISAVPRSARRGGKFFMAEDIWAVIQKLKDSNGNYIADQVGAGLTTVDGMVLGRIWGREVIDCSDILPEIADSAANTKYMIFGNLKHLYLLDRKTISYTLSEHAVVGADSMFEKDRTAVRVRERIGLGVGQGGAFAVGRTTT